MTEKLQAFLFFQQPQKGEKLNSKMEEQKSEEETDLMERLRENKVRKRLPVQRRLAPSAARWTSVRTALKVQRRQSAPSICPSVREHLLFQLALARPKLGIDCQAIVLPPDEGDDPFPCRTGTPGVRQTRARSNVPAPRPLQPGRGGGRGEPRCSA